MVKYIKLNCLGLMWWRVRNYSRVWPSCLPAYPMLLAPTFLVLWATEWAGRLLHLLHYNTLFCPFWCKVHPVNFHAKSKHFHLNFRWKASLIGLAIIGISLMLVRKFFKCLYLTLTVSLLKFSFHIRFLNNNFHYKFEHDILLANKIN